MIAAIDINPTANIVYKHNFPDTKLLNKNIKGLSSKFINDLNIDTILMSPPCQPFTRNGNQLDVNDARTESFVHLLNILNELNIKYVLMENVKAFHGSKMHKIFIKTLENCDFVIEEHVLSPTDFGIPNSRNRYYCLAKKRPLHFLLKTNNLLKVSKDPLFDISSIIETDIKDEERYYLNNDILRRYGNTLDICCKTANRSCCFTKGYGRYVQGTGSVYCNKTTQEVSSAFNVDDKDEQLTYIKLLKLRFFTPKEISRLMSFPDYFQFPTNVTDKQKYMLLGNSINVNIVTRLIRNLL